MYNLEATTYEAFEKDIVKYTQVSVKYLDSIYLSISAIHFEEATLFCVN
jgi:hypothetical protein